MVGERRKPGPRLGRQLACVRIEEVSERGRVGAADPSADLVELGEAERVGALDDERVRLRDVEPGLDDRGRDEDVGVPAQERVHPLLELLLPHLAVRDEKAQPGTQLLQLRGALLDRLDPIVEEERLPLASRFALECELHEVLVVLADGRANRAAPFGRRLDDRDVAHARE